MSNKNVMLCMLVTKNDRYVIPGALKENCYKCGCLVWVSPSSYPQIRKFNMNISCVNCGMRAVNKQIEEKGEAEFNINESQVEEAAGYLADISQKN